MSKLLFLTISLFLGMAANAQVAYQHYLDSTVRWTYEFSTSSPGVTYSSFTEYTVKGDTLVEGVWYWNVWARARTTTNGIAGNSYGPLFGLRETPDKKFYQRYYGVGETLMNDFNLQLGDTLQSDIVHGTFFVDFIDTISFGTQQRVQYRSMFPCAVVEGIGFTHKDGSFNSRMVCFQQQQNIYGLVGSCGFTSVFPIEDDTEFRVIPNPASTEINLELPERWQNQHPIQYVLYNSLGQVQQQGSLAASPHYWVLSVSDIPSGVYMLSLRNGSALKSIRIVVQH